MKILIVPYSDNPYDQRMARGFAEGFIQIGEEAFAVPEAISPEVISQFCDMLSINVVIHINGMRDLDTALPAKVRYISWIQDFFYDIFNNVTERFLSSDILYVLGDVSILRDFNLQCQVRSLFMGIESTIASYRSQSSLKADIDFSLCGYIPGPPNTKKKLIYDLSCSRRTRFCSRRDFLCWRIEVRKSLEYHCTTDSPTIPCRQPPHRWRFGSRWLQCIINSMITFVGNDFLWIFLCQMLHYYK